MLHSCFFTLLSYSLIVDEYCTNAMVTSLKQMPSFKSKIKNNPINLLKAIGEAIHIPVVNQYHFETLINALLRWMTDKQQKDESIDDYLARNRHYASIVEGMLGNDFLSTFIQNTSEYKNATSDEKRKALIDGGFAAWKAYLFWRNSDNDKYGELKGRTLDEYTRRNDQYPKVYKDARDVLACHKIEAKYFEKKKKAKDDANKKKVKDEKSKNQKKEIPSTASGEQHSQNFSSDQQMCFKCGGRGHTAKTCKADIAQSEWVAYKMLDTHEKKTKGKKKAISAKQTAAKESDDSDDSGDEGNAFGIGMCQVHLCVGGDQPTTTNIEEALASLAQGNSDFEFLKECFLLDTGSSMPATIQNEDLVYNIRESNNPAVMTTNAGTRTMNKDATIPGLGDVKFDPELTANVLGFHFMRTKFKVEYDHNKNEFIVHASSGPMVFKERKGLYVYEPTKRYLKFINDKKGQEQIDDHGTGFLTTDPADLANHSEESPTTGTSSVLHDDDDQAGVPMERPTLFQDNSIPEEPMPNVSGVSTDRAELATFVQQVMSNTAGYTDRQVSRAHAARILYHECGAPQLSRLKSMLRTGQVHNTPVTPADIDLAEKIFGPDIPTLKGRTVRKTPPTVKDDVAHIPPELMKQRDDLTLAMDVMYIQGHPVLTAIDNVFKYRMVSWMADRSMKEFYRAIDVFTRKYNDSGCTITRIRCDQEFIPLIDPVCDEMGVKMDYPPRGTTFQRPSETIVSSRNGFASSTIVCHLPRCLKPCGRLWWSRSRRNLIFYPQKTACQNTSVRGSFWEIRNWITNAILWPVLVTTSRRITRTFPPTTCVHGPWTAFIFTRMCTSLRVGILCSASRLVELLLGLGSGRSQ